MKAQVIPETVVTTTLSPETEQLARRVAASSGRTVEDVVRQGVEIEARIVGVSSAADKSSSIGFDMSRAREIAQRIARRPLLDTRPPQEILDQAWDKAFDRRR